MYTNKYTKSLYILSLLFILLICANSLIAQTIEGIVIDDQKNPIPNVIIRVIGTEIMSTSSSDGSYKLNFTISDSNAVSIVFTSIGFQSQKINVNLKSNSSQWIEVILNKEIYKTPTLVVTASRTKEDIEEVTIPVQVITSDEIRRTGSITLSDILSEQVGLQISNDHGTGIQVQGFDPDYTHIMIDGSPLIGRTAGTLDLNRISVQKVKQIEIVKGPSSALWGSNALAGVINIITERSQEPMSWGIQSRYSENNTLSLGSNFSFQTESWKNDLFINRISSSGYKLIQNSISQTVPNFENYTFSYQTEFKISERISLNTTSRYFVEQQDNKSTITQDGFQQILDSDSNQEDLMIRPSLRLNPLDRLNIDLSFLNSYYKTTSQLTFEDTNSIYEATTFDQQYKNPEFQANYLWDNRNHSIIGSGVVYESLKADRYTDNPRFTTTYFFIQHQWSLLNNLDLTGGVRFDSHSEYSSQLSPKFSGRYKLSDKIQIRASIGRGFKAPEFRQLFLDFTNSTQGYSVFGSSTVVERIEQLQLEGNIAQILIPLDLLEEIKAESSWSTNFGIDLEPIQSTRLRVNFFRNNLSDLIETAPIARLTNGQAAFSYFNLEKVYTQGIESDLQFKTNYGLQISIGYQWLDARRYIDVERNVQNEDGEIISKRFTSYEKMFNRSSHSGNLKIFYEHKNGWSANIRGSIRGKYGLFDTNGNTFVDSSEFEPAYSIWNFAVSKSFFKSLNIQLGANNLLDYKNLNIPYLSGRVWYAQATIHFQ